jgi:trigger factor
MKTTLERLEPTRVKLTVEVEPKRVSKAFDAAARDLSKSVDIKGFRRGKVPRRVLEARFGKDLIIQQALEGSVSRYYAEALEHEEVVPVAPPEIDLQTFTEEEGCAFEATVDVRPEIEPPDHRGIHVTFPEWEVTDEEVRQQLDQMRERFAELEEVDRPARRGDYVTIDLSVARNGAPIEEATAEDALYEVGSGGVTPKLDEELAGAAPGHILKYTDELPPDYPEHGGEEVEFTVLVKDVRGKQLPDLDDDFAATASEFDTLGELEEDIRATLRRRRLSTARQELRGRVLEAYLALADVPLPEKMVEAERDGRLDQLRRQAEQYGLELEQLLQMQGTDLEKVTADVEEQAESTVKGQLVLEALAEQEGIQVESTDLEQEIRRHAANQDVDPATLARVINEQGSVGVLIGDVVRRKALDLIVDAAEVEDAPSDQELAELGFGPEPAATDAAAGPGPAAAQPEQVAAQERPE